MMADIHLHALAGVDDGPRSDRDMFAMLDAIHAEGTRTLCLTPHFHPGYFGDNRKKAEEAFARLRDFAGERYPDVALYLGNELRYSPDCLSWLADGACRTMNGSRYILVDFSAREERRTILRGLDSLMNAGYTPVLAHGERYESLGMDLKELKELRRRGAAIQVDGGSLFGAFGLGAKLRSRAMLRQGIADLVASDAHDLTRRPPVMEKTRAYIEKHHGPDAARLLCRENPMHILADEAIRKGRR